MMFCMPSVEQVNTFHVLRDLVNTSEAVWLFL